MERVGEEARDEMAEDDLFVGDASRWAEDVAGVWGGSACAGRATAPSM